MLEKVKTMKKRDINRHIVTDFVQVILYLDDIKRIIALMKDAGFTIHIIHEDFEYSSIEELISDTGERLRQLRLLGSNEGKEFIVVDYSDGKYRLATFCPTFTIGDAWNSILKIFRSNIDPWYWRLDFGIFNSLQLTTLLLINSFIEDKTSPIYYIGLGFWGFYFLISLYSFWYRNTHNKLILSNRSKSTFFAKYGKEILLLVIGGVITLIVTLIATLLL